MRVDIVVPQIGEAVAELHIVMWHKAVGDTIKTGDVLFEVDSDKAIVEVEAFVDGTLVEIKHGDGSAVLPKDVVAVVETVDTESASSSPQTTTTSTDGKNDLRQKEVTRSSNGQSVTPVAERVAADFGVNIADIQGTGPRGRVVADDIYRFVRDKVRDGVSDGDGRFLTQVKVNASPKARRIAKELGVSLAGLQGTGVDSMIVVKDVEAASKQRRVAPVSNEPITAPSAPTPNNNLSKLRQTVAERTTKAKQTVPHFYLEVDVNMSEVNALRDFCVEKMKWERPPTYTDVLLRACALALSDLTWANQSYIDGGLQQRSRVSIGVAVGTDTGLLVPVLPDVDQLSLRQTSAASRAMIARARDGRLKPGDMGEKSIVVSNLGMFSVDRFTAIIDIPDPMILAVGRVIDRVVAQDGQAVIQPMCTMTLSVDHRAFDGVQGAKVLGHIKDVVENPFQILG